ncbi:lasso RiPP family leader peptide-containing protein [Marinilongibacter aquaticus]|nr:lasso RiPP family leader peptide-containing protein [Marinilongibacter aquaticus]UBM60756.1 lasso RiPP family leader peptide-containing protein [Marinilongibacter aquaticus]UBM60758.1 lasso RiPP family leader peptide-containing protein [Marinilongibacter aquaticus]
MNKKHTSRNKYTKPSLKKLGSVKELTLKTGSSTDGFTVYTP